MSSDAPAFQVDAKVVNQGETSTEDRAAVNGDGSDVPANDAANPYELLEDGHKKYAKGKDPMLRYLKPYWWPYRTFVKNRWIGRELLEVVSTEFRDRSVEYYVGF